MGVYFKVNPNEKFNDKWFWKWDLSGAGAWDGDVNTGNPADGLCNYEVTELVGPLTIGLKQKTRIKKYGKLRKYKRHI